MADNYSMDDVRDGLVLNMALILDDPRSVTDVIDVITALNEREDLNILGASALWSLSAVSEKLRVSSPFG